MRLKRIAASVGVALALSVAATAAQAANEVIGQNASYSFGMLSQSAAVSVGDPVDGFYGAYDNVFTFTQASYSGATTLFAGIDAFKNLTAQYRFGVLASGSTTPTWLTEYSASSLVPSNTSSVFSIANTLSNLTPGTTYAIEIKGTAGTTIDDGQATYTLTLAPTGVIASVPEPESFAMLLAGLGLMGAVARRRRNVTAA